MQGKFRPEIGNDEEEIHLQIVNITNHFHRLKEIFYSLFGKL